jgi:hypothetical protein
MYYYLPILLILCVIFIGFYVGLIVWNYNMFGDFNLCLKIYNKDMSK